MSYRSPHKSKSGLEITDVSGDSSSAFELSGLNAASPQKGTVDEELPIHASQASMAAYLYYASQYRDLSRGKSTGHSTGQTPETASPPSQPDYELRTAKRAIRTATWTSAFFLITTDILGNSFLPA